MIDAFIEQIDRIYFFGYAEQTAVEDPEKFKFELDEFLKNYGSGLKGS